jgi:curved DNA-binding protein CbpA
MALIRDPYRILGLPRDATLDEVKAAYRRLAKQSHPDSAGEKALPRFLAIQAAYELLTEGPHALRLGARSAARPAPPRPARPAAADSDRTRAPHEPPRSRTGRSHTRAAGGDTSTGAAGPGGAAGSAGAAGPGGATGPGASDGGPRTARSRARSKATPGSTAYDGVENEPFEPSWEGASWYGGGSGTYWTINPKEYADPRKHGPEYLERARRVRAARRPGSPARPPEAADD